MWLKWPVWACGRAQALSVRFDRRAVGADRAGGARAALGWPSSGAFEAPRRGRHPLRQPHRVRVASTAARLSTMGDGVLVPAALARGRCGQPMDPARPRGTGCQLGQRSGPRWPRPAAWTPSRSKAPTPSGRPCAGSMPARRSTAASATSWSTRWVLLLLVVITSASVQDRDGARTLLDRLTMAMPSLSLLWANCGEAGWSSPTGCSDPYATSPSRSCVNPWESRCSRCFHGGGWSSAPSPGS